MFDKKKMKRSLGRNIAIATLAVTLLGGAYYLGRNSNRQETAYSTQTEQRIQYKEKLISKEKVEDISTEKTPSLESILFENSIEEKTFVRKSIDSEGYINLLMP